MSFDSRFTQIVGFEDGTYPRKDKTTGEIKEYVNCVNFSFLEPYSAEEKAFGHKADSISIVVADFGKVFGVKVAEGVKMDDVLDMCRKFVYRDCIIETNSRSAGDKFYGDYVKKITFIDEILALANGSGANLKK